MYPNLNAEMARKGINKTELSRLVNMSLPNLSNKLSGRVKFSFDETLKIKEALGVDMTVEELFEKKAV